MYGLVNKAIEDLVVSLTGEETWLEIVRRAGIDVVTFVSLDSYPDEYTHRLVTAASEVLDLPPHEVLERFGEHWVRYTGREGYGHLLAAYGTDVATFLGNLDALHSRVIMIMPELRPPSFRIVEDGPGRFLVHYHSTRTGLAPMVTGLLRGIGSLFDVQLSVERRERREDGADHDVFAVTITPEDPAPTDTTLDLVPADT